MSQGWQGLFHAPTISSASNAGLQNPSGKDSCLFQICLLPSRNIKLDIFFRGQVFVNNREKIFKYCYKLSLDSNLPALYIVKKEVYVVKVRSLQELSILKLRYNIIFKRPNCLLLSIVRKMSSYVNHEKKNYLCILDYDFY